MFEATSQPRQAAPWQRHLPNLITFLRLLLLPLFVYLALRCRGAVLGGDSGSIERWGATLTLFVIGVGDVVDGYLARRYGSITALGKVLDPLADKLAQVTGLVVFTFFGEPAFERLPWALLVVILVRDLVLALGSLVLNRHRKLEIEPVVVGKAASVATVTLLMVVSSGLSGAVVDVLVGLSGLLIVWSGAVYVSRGWGLWKRPERPAL